MEEENNNEILGKIKTTGKKFGKILLKGIKIKAIIIISIILIIVFLIPAFWYLFDLNICTENSKNKKNTPAAIRSQLNEISIDEEENIIRFGQTPQEFWDELVKQNNDVVKYGYLNSPAELSKLMKAELVTKLLYMGDKPEEEINIEEYLKEYIENPDSNEMQGIIKLKRKMSDKSEKYMTYKSQQEFQGLIDEYNNLDEEDEKRRSELKEEILCSFTIETRYVDADTGNIVYNIIKEDIDGRR